MRTAPVTLDLQLDYSPLHRSSGLHVSEIYNRYYQAVQPRRYKKLTADDANPTLMGLGLAWEAHLERVLARAGIEARRPGEFIDQGIAFSPDLLIENGRDMVGEIKLTRYKMEAYTGEKFAKWVTQMKAYCYKLEIPRARLFALHLNGDYRKHRDPILVVTDFEFSAKELREEWARLMAFARQKRML